MEIIKNEHLAHDQLITCENCMYKDIKVNDNYYLCEKLDKVVAPNFFCAFGSVTWESDGQSVKINGK